MGAELCLAHDMGGVEALGPPFGRRLFHSHNQPEKCPRTLTRINCGKQSIDVICLLKLKHCLALTIIFFLCNEGTPISKI